MWTIFAEVIQLFGDELPTTEPAPTPGLVEPTVTRPTIDIEPSGNRNQQPSAVSEPPAVEAGQPTTSNGDESEQPTSDGNPPIGSDSPSPDGSSAWVMSMTPAALSSLLTIVAAWN